MNNKRVWWMTAAVNGARGDYWQYKVNVMPGVGAGAYALASGDAVECFFGPSQE